ncbi:uncharacterized protein LOC143428499 [Xylocopa sonorina]|uniref:uncharacterized protein LOC143428499 n=1 Tax=Xylocopa sonorina TaxID=1818115 RepID=UPI00403AAA6C
MSLVPSNLRRFTSLLLVFAFARPVNFIVVPANYAGIREQEREREAAPERENESGDRRYIVETLTNDDEEREEFLGSIPCIESFLKKHLVHRSSISFLTPDDDETIHRVSHGLVANINGYFALYRHNLDRDLTPVKRAKSTIILTSNVGNLNVSSHIISPCDRGCPYVAIPITRFLDEESFLEQADVLARAMWTRRISSVVILARVRDSVLAGGSIVFQPDKPCTPAPSVILDKCEGGSWSGSLKGIKPPEMNRCILKIAYFDEPPYVITSNDSERLDGFEGRLTEAVMRDQEIDRERIEWTDNASYTEQIQTVLYSETMADLVIGRVLQQSNPDIDYSTSYDILQVVWVVPKVNNVSLKGLVQPFQPYIWAAIGCTLLLAFVVKIFLKNDLSWLETFALIIGVATARQPTRLSIKIRFISWSIFGLFLTQFYVDSLADHLINTSGLKIDTIEELLSSSFNIGGNSALAALFDDFTQDEVTEKIRETMVIFDQQEYTQQFVDLVEGKNSSFALVVVLNSSRSGAIDTVHAYTMTTDVICSSPLAVAAWRGFPDFERINDKIHRYIDFGIFDRMIELAIGRETRAMLSKAEQNKEYKSELHWEQFIPAFLLTLIGFASGFLFFLLEIVFYPSKLLLQ